MRNKRKYRKDSAAPASKKGLDTKRKLDIIGILMMVLALLLLLAFISHSHADETVADVGMVDFLRLFGGDPEIQARADTTSNWLGLFGAIIANFFINITIGYFAIAFPVLLMLWGWSIFRRRDLKTLAYYTNYSLVLVLLLSALLGLLRLIQWLPDISVSWSGNIGDFVAGLVSRLIGTTGGIIVFFTTIIILAVIVVDYDIQASLERVKNAGRWIARNMKGRASTLQTAFQAERSAVATEQQETVPSENAMASVSRKAKRNKPPVAPQATADPPVIVQAPARVSIARPLHTDAHLPFHAHDEAATPRSNGVISRDSVEGLRDYFESAPALVSAENPNVAGIDTSIAQDGVGTSDSTEVVREKKRPVRPELPTGDGDRGYEQISMAVPSSDGSTEETDNSLSTIADNEHERKAVLEAGERKDLQIGAVEDIDSINQKMARTKLTYKMPPPDLLDPQHGGTAVTDEELRLKAAQVKEKLAVFGIEITGISIAPGPVVTLFELVPDSSVKISKIVSLADDLALALAARGIRIIAPIPGKSAVGIEIPNNQPEIVNFRSVVTSSEFQNSRHKLTLGMGKSINGMVLCDDLAKMPHLLIAGATGSGKSVGINVMITSLLYRLRPQDVKFVMIDPKKIELAQYRGLSRHFLAICPDIKEEIITDPANAVLVLKSLEMEMDMRYTKLAKAGVRHMNDYNEKVKSGQLRDSSQLKHYQLPYIVVIIDELADLMITAAREIEEPIARLAQMARAVGMHLIVATQRPSVDVITGMIKANFPARAAYHVASRVDSRTVLDTQGAEQLLGNGDMLFMPGGHPKPIRIQNAFLSTAEVERVVEFIADQQGFQRPYTLPSVVSLQKARPANETAEYDDFIYEAAHLIVKHQKGSVSLLQRHLRIGYSRAARIIDQLEIAGLVGPYDGIKPREVLVEDEAVLNTILQEL